MLPGEILCHVYKFCGVKDLARSIEICRYFETAMRSWGAETWGALIQRKWYGREIRNRFRKQKEFKAMRALWRTLRADWPIQIDLQHLHINDHAHAIRCVPCELYNGRGIGFVYAGSKQIGFGDRCIRADKAFDVRTDDGKILLPGDEIVSFRGGGGYYEIKILDNKRRLSSGSNSTNQNNIRSRREQTIAIGLAAPSFPLTGRQPGWDMDGLSFGYHSDDGKKFWHGGFGQAYSEKYGPGDVIGCGFCVLYGHELKRFNIKVCRRERRHRAEDRLARALAMMRVGDDDDNGLEEDDEDIIESRLNTRIRRALTALRSARMNAAEEDEIYEDGGKVKEEDDMEKNLVVYFTRNGKYLGEAFVLRELVWRNRIKKLFPIVGLDSRDIVSFNFGRDLNEPFQFDLRSLPWIN